MSRYKAGDQISAADLNKLLDLYERLKTIKVGRGMIMKNFPGGVFFDTVATDATVPTGTLQGQNYLMISDNQAAWDFTFFTSMTS